MTYLMMSQCDILTLLWCSIRLLGLYLWIWTNIGNSSEIRPIIKTGTIVIVHIVKLTRPTLLRNDARNTIVLFSCSANAKCLRKTRFAWFSLPPYIHGTNFHNIFRPGALRCLDIGILFTKQNGSCDWCVFEMKTEWYTVYWSCMCINYTAVVCLHFIQSLNYTL